LAPLALDDFTAAAFFFAGFADVLFFFEPKMFSQFLQNSGVAPVRTIGPLVGIADDSWLIRSLL
jgi:hypothetical protein